MIPPGNMCSLSVCHSSIHLLIYPSINLLIHPSINLLIHPSINLLINLLIYLTNINIHVNTDIIANCTNTPRATHPLVLTFGPMTISISANNCSSKDNITDHYIMYITWKIAMETQRKIKIRVPS